jgi:hypothetical protein
VTTHWVGQPATHSLTMKAVGHDETATQS